MISYIYGTALAIHFTSAALANLYLLLETLYTVIQPHKSYPVLMQDEQHDVLSQQLIYELAKLTTRP